MTKQIPFLIIFFILLGCGKSGGQAAPTLVSGEMQSAIAPGKVSLKEVALSLPVPAAALNFDVQLEFEQFSARQEIKVLEAAELIKKVVASEDFKQAVLQHRWQGKLQFANNKGLSNRAIYKRIVEASEKLNKGIDNTMNLKLIAYHANNRVVGYTYPGVMTVWMNKKFLNQRQAHEVTVNMMHEWLHKLGFGHDFQATPMRPYSVPYALGYIMGRLAKKMS